MESLPDVCVVRILGFLAHNPMDLFRARQVCRRWKELGETADYIWEKPPGSVYLLRYEEYAYPPDGPRIADVHTLHLHTVCVKRFWDCEGRIPYLWMADNYRCSHLTMVWVPNGRTPPNLGGCRLCQLPIALKLNRQFQGMCPMPMCFCNEIIDSYYG